MMVESGSWAPGMGLDQMDVTPDSSVHIMSEGYSMAHEPCLHQFATEMETMGAIRIFKMLVKLTSPPALFYPFKCVTKRLKMAQGPFIPLGTFGSGLHSHHTDEEPEAQEVLSYGSSGDTRRKSIGCIGWQLGRHG